VPTWRFLDTGTADGETNMAVDAAVLRAVQSCASPPTVRVYAWSPPAVSLGVAQDAAQELDLEECSRRGYAVVRRPTGGRAVLHAGEITYSVAGPIDTAPLGRSIGDTYEAVSRALVEGLRSLGADVTLAPVPRRSGRRRGASPPCFMSAGRFEILADGRKLVGSAQRRTESAVLQHGSILLDETHVGLADVIRCGSEAERSSIRSLLVARTTSLSALLGRRVCYGEATAALRLGFERAWDTVLVPGRLSEREFAAAAALATEYRVAA
jgi:lipoyl(octanoyl) transferase